MSTSSNAKLLEIANLTMDFRTDEGPVRALDDVSLSIEAGQVLGLVGESGSGKSVTARSIMRLNPGNALIQPESRITLNDGARAYDVLSLRDHALRTVRGGKVSMIFQEPMASFAPAIRLGDQITETICIHLGCTRKEARRRGIELFERVGIPIPEMRFDQYVYELSGGMRQRAMIAMALATKPKLLIADEPTTALDVTIQAQVLDLMMELREKEGMAMLFITHDLGVVSQVADDVTVMKKGRVMEAGPVDDVLYSPQDGYTRRLIEALPSMDRIKELPEHRTDSEALIEVSDLSVSYPVTSGRSGAKVFHAVRNMNIRFPLGDIIGLVGESGSGKSSLGRAMLGAAPISSGKVEYRTIEPISISANNRVNRKKLARVAQLVFQDPYGSLNPRMTVRDIIAEPLEALGLTQNRKETDEKVKEIARLCHLDVSHLRRFPHAFSGGQRQRISIARALVCELLSLSQMNLWPHWMYLSKRRFLLS